jgi:hypothetical protein
MSQAATIVARIAGAERALAFARAETLARTLGGRAHPWWDEPRACVAMLVRHGDPAILSVLDDTPATYWSTAVPDLQGLPAEVLRSLLAAWWSELPRALAGEVFLPTPPPTPPPRMIEAPAPQGNLPTPPPPPVERSLSPEDAAKRLERLHRRWFAPSTERADEAPDDDTGSQEPPRAWWEVAPDAEDRDALWLVVPPVGVADEGPRALRWEGAAPPFAIRRENLARLGARTLASPTVEVVWRSADAIPDTLREALTPAALAQDVPTLFRRDIDGPSQRAVSLRVARGARYAVLLPPSLAPKIPSARALDGGWALWSLQVPDDPAEALLTTLSSLGITVGEAITELTFALVPPTRWSHHGRGVAHPVFADDPVVRVRASPARSDLTLFLHGPDGTHAHPLASVSAVELSLDGLRDGAYILELTARDFTVTPTRVAFAIDRAAVGVWPRTRPSVRLDGETVTDATTTDLTALGPRLEVTATPAARVRLRWEGFSRWECALHADADGRVPLDTFDARSAPLRAYGAEGRLTVDFGEDGVVTLGHQRTLAGVFVETREALTALSQDAVMLTLGDVVVLRDWAERAAQALGYAPKSVSVSPVLAAGGWLAMRLDDLRWIDGRRTVSAAWVLAVTPPHANPGSPESAPRRAALDALAKEVGASGIILTDGARWWCVLPGRPRLPRLERLDDALGDDDALEAFLSRYSAWR